MNIAEKPNRLLGSSWLLHELYNSFVTPELEPPNYNSPKALDHIVRFSKMYQKIGLFINNTCVILIKEEKTLKKNRTRDSWITIPES